MIHTVVPTLLGPLLVVSDGEAVTRVAFDAEPPAASRADDAALGEAREQLAAYFAGEPVRFRLALRPEGTPFQQRVWSLLADIPHGVTRSYGSLARALGDPGAAQAVGAANGANPIAVVLPCHRVVGADGSLTGYAGGLHRKRALLDLERGQTALFP